ncbi:MAG: isopentenyl phosphate kinase [Candidatus Thalassarchaeaceae archaeon]|jgi:isopentenyl phosphate kinase|nr:isopentenyl phosphate kinase [Candidatus Thalassarchaeaceae archaeon]
MSRVIIKWGGGLITDKEELCVVRQDIIDKLALMTKKIHGLGYDVIIIHGAGSFGHLRAIEFDLANGRNSASDIDQDAGVELVRADMLELNKIVVQSLEGLNLPVSSHYPRDFITNTGSECKGDLTSFSITPSIHVAFGDVVICDSPRDFGILSGDDLMFRLATDLPNVSHVIFAMGDVPGLLSLPPSNPNAKLLETWSSSRGFAGVHNNSIDTTGGIFLKAKRAAGIANSVEHVWFVDGTLPERIFDIVTENCSIGTRVIQDEE